MTRRKRKSNRPIRPEIAGSGPVRTCVGCGRRDRQGRMIRFGQAASGGLEIVGARSIGRSAYVHSRDECMQALKSTKLLRRSLRADIDQAERAAIVTELVTTSGD